MKMPSTATQRPSLCAPQSRRLTCQPSTRTEQQPMNSRLVKPDGHILFQSAALGVYCRSGFSLCFEFSKEGMVIVLWPSGVLIIWS